MTKEERIRNNIAGYIQTTWYKLQEELKEYGYLDSENEDDCFACKRISDAVIRYTSDFSEGGHE